MHSGKAAPVAYPVKRRHSDLTTLCLPTTAADPCGYLAPVKSFDAMLWHKSDLYLAVFYSNSRIYSPICALAMG
jgi:hypothetical protein